MSFSSDLKLELYGKMEKALHCRIALLAGIISISGRTIVDEGSEVLEVRVDNQGLDHEIRKLMLAFSIPEEDIVLSDEALHHRKLVLRNSEHIAKIKLTCKLQTNGRFLLSEPIVTSKECCKKAFLRGAFLAGGSVGDPNKSYQMEISASNYLAADRVKELMTDIGIITKEVKRKDRSVVYLKDGDTISSFMGLMGGSKSLMEFENIRILKDLRNNVNREVNCDTANIAKTANAAAKQIEDINFIVATKGWGFLSDNLKEIAVLRLENPDLSLRELAEKMELGKSGVRHRFDKIGEIAETLRNS